MENIEKDVLKKESFLALIIVNNLGCDQKTAPPILLNFSGYNYARGLEHISYERWDP